MKLDNLTTTVGSTTETTGTTKVKTASHGITSSMATKATISKVPINGMATAINGVVTTNGTTTIKVTKVTKGTVSHPRKT